MQDKKEGCFDGPVVQREDTKEKNTKAGYLRDKTDQLTRGPPRDFLRLSNGWP